MSYRVLSRSIRAFTLLEMLISIAILTVLAGIAVPIAKKAMEDAKVAKMLSVVGLVKKAAWRFYLDTGALSLESENPPIAHNLFRAPVPPDVVPNWKGPYIDRPLSSDMSPFSQKVELRRSLSGATGGGGYNIGGTILNTAGCEMIFDKIPFSVAQKLDLELDGAISESKGFCEYTVPDRQNNVTVTICLFPAQ